MLAGLRTIWSADIPLAASLEAATADYQTGHFDSALTKLDQQDRAQGPTAESRDLRGEISLQQGNFVAAEQAFTAAHKQARELFPPRLHLAGTYLREKKYSAAREVYEKLAAETNIFTSNERVRHALLVTALAARDRVGTKDALDSIKFPTETPAYYFAQAAAEFAQGNESAAGSRGRFTISAGLRKNPRRPQFDSLGLVVFFCLFLRCPTA